MKIITVTPEMIAEKSNLHLSDVQKAYDSLGQPKMQFRRPDDTERQSLIEAAKNENTKDNLRVAGSSDNSIWSKGWGEVLEGISAGPVNLETIKPQYFKHSWLRLWGEYAKIESPDLEYWLGNILRLSCFYQYFQEQHAICEFGCGTGINVLLLQSVFPTKKIIATDWVEESCLIAEKIKSQSNADIATYVVDMQNPKESDQHILTSGTGLLTVHALEQLGGNFQNLFTLLSKNPPAIVVNIEPIIELYENDAFDSAAHAYHQKRNYLDHWLTFLRGKEQKGEIELINVNRMGLGSQFHEAYSLIAWKFV